MLFRQNSSRSTCNSENHVDSHTKSASTSLQIWKPIFINNYKILFFSSSLKFKHLVPSFHCGELKKITAFILMDSWSYGSEGKGLSFTDGMDLPDNAFASTREAQLSWDIKPSTDFEAVENMDSMDSGFSYMNKKPFDGNTSLGIVGAEIANDYAKRLVSPTCMFISSSYYGENESGSKQCSSLMEFDSQESSLIDSKLGRLSGYTQDGKLLKESSIVSSIFPALTAKKARTTSSPCCQVYGCNKDLSFSKGYHKRHKVCEAHSKTPKVIVNGIEQRFCQQCSRFHLLAEFDDVKRSCRKRLAGHNERRRKLHFDTLPGKPSKLLQTYQGAKFLGNSMVKRAPSGDETEEKPIYSPQSAIPVTNWQLVPKSSFHMHGIGTFSSATEAFNDPNIASSRVEESYGVPHSDYALSLLSPQSQYSSNHAHHSSGKYVAIGSLEKANGFYTYGVGQEGSSGAGHTVKFEAQTYEYQDSVPLSARYCNSPENGTSFDLLQLSTNFQRVEGQRN